MSLISNEVVNYKENNFMLAEYVESVAWWHEERNLIDGVFVKEADL